MNTTMLRIASLISILFMAFHLADDIVRRFDPGGFKNMGDVPVAVEI